MKPGSARNRKDGNSYATFYGVTVVELELPTLDAIAAALLAL